MCKPLMRQTLGCRSVPIPCLTRHPQHLWCRCYSLHVGAGEAESWSLCYLPEVTELISSRITFVDPNLSASKVHVITTMPTPPAKSHRRDETQASSLSYKVGKGQLDNRVQVQEEITFG